jgi:serine/threonine-protein kinase
VATGPDDDDDEARARVALALTEDASLQTLPRPEGPLVIHRRSVGRFRIDAELGSGGMADVYRAHDPLLDRAVALKVLHTRTADGDTQGMRRVLREARAAAALTHPNTVTIFEVGEADREVFIAMELLEGRTLRDTLDHGKPSLDDKLRWLLEAARALEAAHERGLVHRDVKPENMFVCSSGTLKLLDFGIAKRDDDEGDPAGEGAHGPSSLRTHAGRRLGTPRYMAPEQHAGLATDARTDEYAWGLVAFEMLCNSHVSSAQPTVTSEEHVAPDGAASNLRRAELLTKVPELPEAVAASIARALEPRKEDRFPSMAPIIAALEAKVQSAASPTAEPPSRAGRWWLVSVLTAATLLVIAGGLRLRRSARAARNALDAAVVLAPGACRTVRLRQRQSVVTDVVAVLPNDAILFVRHAGTSLAVDRETADGFAPVVRAPELLALMHFDRLRSRGTTLDGNPALYLAGRSPIEEAHGGHTNVIVLGNDGQMRNASLGNNVRSTAFTTLGTEIVTLLAAGTPEVYEPSAGASLHLLQSQRRHLVEEAADVDNPTIAASDTQLAVAYSVAERTHFALLDERLERVGEPVLAPPADVPTWLAFAGDRPVLFWLDTRTAKVRLVRATYQPAARTFTAPEVAVDEAIVSGSPVTARLPDGSFVLAWVRSAASGLTLRSAPIGAGGALGAASDLATAASFGDLRVTQMPEGLAFVWTDGTGGSTIANVVCQPPTSRPDR